METVFEMNKKTVKTSFEMAEKLKKQHGNLLQTIYSIMKRIDGKDIFIENFYYDKNRNKRRFIEITEKGLEILNNKTLVPQSKNLEFNTLYIVKHKDIENYYKIGITKNLEKRLKSLNNASPTGIEVVYQLESENVRKLEKDIHELLKGYNSNLEWFKLTEEKLQETLHCFKTKK